MPHHTKKHRSSRRRSSKKYSSRPSQKEHGFLIRSRHISSRGKPRSMKNIHHTVYNAFPHLRLSAKQARLNRAAANMNAMRNVSSLRASHSRAAKNAHRARLNAARAMEQEEKQRELEEKQARKEAREEKQERKAAQAAAVSNLNAMMSKMHF